VEAPNPSHLAVTRLMDVLAATHDREAIVAATVDSALLLVPAEAAVYYRRVGEPGELAASHTAGAAAAERLRLVGSGVAGHAARTGQVAVFPGSARPDPAEPPSRSAVAVPVSARGRLVGVLAAYRRRTRRPFDADEIVSLQSLVHAAELALTNVELHEQAQRDALTDGLTGLWNRRYLDMRCEDAVLAGRRFGEPFSVVLFDLDDFKKVNDRFDHLTGDAALVHFARLLRSATRDVDVACRWGGEEFAVLLQRTGPKESVEVAQRVLRALKGDPFSAGGEVIAVTATAGVASYPADGLTPLEVTAAADAALMRAKAAGKDRVEPAAP